MNLENFIEKERWNAGYADGFKAGLEHAEKTIRNIESRLTADLIACGFKDVDPAVVPIFRQIIKEMWEGEKA